MSISSRIKDTLKTIQPGEIFGVDRFKSAGNPQAVILSLKGFQATSDDYSRASRLMSETKKT